MEIGVERAGRPIAKNRVEVIGGRYEGTNGVDG